MKLSAISFLMLSCLAFSSAFGSTDCVDRRVAFITPCDEGKELVFLQGQCKESYEFEHAYCSVSSGASECLDRRAVFIAPCDEGKELVFVQGKCEKSYQAETFYCASR